MKLTITINMRGDDFATRDAADNPCYTDASRAAETAAILHKYAAKIAENGVDYVAGISVYSTSGARVGTVEVGPARRREVTP